VLFYVFFRDSNNELSASWVDYGTDSSNADCSMSEPPRVITPPRIRSPLVQSPQSSPAYVFVLTLSKWLKCYTV